MVAIDTIDFGSLVQEQPDNFKATNRASCVQRPHSSLERDWRQLFGVSHCQLFFSDEGMKEEFLQVEYLVDVIDVRPIGYELLDDLLVS